MFLRKALRHALAALTVMMMPTAAMAQDGYGLILYYISEGEDGAEVEVTSENASDVFGDGTVSFNQETNTLILNGASFGSYSGCVYADAVIDNLTVMLIGNSTLKSAEGFFFFGADEPQITFVTSDNNPGTLTFSSLNGVDLDKNMPFGGFEPTFENGLAFSRKGPDYYIGTFETYPLWIDGEQVTELNKTNFFYDEGKTVRFDDATDTLTLAGIYIDCYSGTFVSCDLADGLIVKLVGTNTVNYASTLFYASASEASKPLTFISGGGEGDKLRWYTGQVASPSGSELASGFTPAYQGLELYEEDNMIAAPYVDYGITVAGIGVSNLNADDVFGDGGTVTYDRENDMLTLNNAVMKEGTIMVQNREEGEPFTVFLKGDNSGVTSFHAIDCNPLLVFTTDANDPGSLTIEYDTENGEFYSGFIFNADSDCLEAGLSLIPTPEGCRIGVVQPIEPIINEEDPQTYTSVGGNESDYADLEGTVIDNVLYSLPSDDHNGYDDADGIPGIVLGTSVSDADVAAAAAMELGSAEFLDKFKGLVIKTPAGAGDVTVTARSYGGQLRVKVGDEEPYTLEGITTDGFNTVAIPYYCHVPTCIYVYLEQPEAADGRTAIGSFREKVKTTGVKYSGCGGVGKAMFTGGVAALYSLPTGALDTKNGTLTLSTVKRDSWPVDMGPILARKAAPRKAVTDETEYPIASLSPNIFSSITDKEGLYYVDMAGTQLKDIIVNRDMGMMAGFPQHTLILLPEGNDDGGEQNVVVDGNCRLLSLDETTGFMAPAKTFTAAKAELNHTFTPGLAATLMLPFGIDAADAASLGKFFRLKTLGERYVVFEPSDETVIPANKPRLFIPQTTAFSLETAVTVEGNNAATATDGLLTGTYKHITLADEALSGGYIFKAPDVAEGKVEGTFVKAAEETAVLPFTACLKAEGAADVLKVIDDEVATGVQSVEVLRQTSENTYDLQGRKIVSGNLRSGLYISNNKKIIVR